MKLEYFRERFEKYSNIKYHENSSERAEFFHADRPADGQTDRQTDRHDEANLIVAFRNFAKGPKIY